jgi:hypothetical protein
MRLTTYETERHRQPVRQKLKTVIGRAAAMGLSATLALSALAISARADDLVTNGSFEVTTAGPGQLGYNTTANGWSSTGYNFIFASGTADNTVSGGSPGQYGNVYLWGPNDGSANGLPASSPDGGNYVAADGAFGVAPIQQTIDGLTVGSTYTVGFWWAGAQQYNFFGPNTEQWQVSLGSQSQSTVVVDNSSQGFTGWTYQTFTYTATSASEVLSFLAVGTPNGVPPFSLLDGVSLYAAAPEPSSWILILGALGLAGGIRGIRSKKLLRRS